MIAALMESPALRKKSFTRVAALMGAVIRAGSCWRMVRSGTRLLNTPVPHSTTANAATAATRVYRLKNTRTALRPALVQITTEPMYPRSLKGIKADCRLTLRAALSALPEREQQVLLLRYYRGMTQVQTARVLGVSQVQVSRLERRALDRLRQELVP